MKLPSSSVWAEFAGPDLSADASPVTGRCPPPSVFERVADAETSHVTVRPDDGVWQPFVPGVAIKVLDERDEVLSYLLRLAPGAALPMHAHRMDEECLVLAGTLRVGSGVVLEHGAYHLARRGSLHATMTTDGGATLFVRGAVPELIDLVDRRFEGGAR